jgi:hypothetical protein
MLVFWMMCMYETYDCHISKFSVADALSVILLNLNYRSSHLQIIRFVRRNSPDELLSLGQVFS